MKSKWFGAVLVIGMIALVGCMCTPAVEPTVKPLPTVGATAAPTEVPAPTDVPLPTGTPEPTEIPTVVPTRPPTDTPEPTDTPTPAATAMPEVALTSIGGITAGRAGEEVTVEAKVVGTESFQAGFKFTLDDGTGQIVLLMWHDVYDECWDAAEINLGARVRATGEIGEYEGVLQVEPDFGGDVKAIEGAAPWAPARDIGSLSGDDEGRRVMIEGRVVRVEGTGTWAKVFVGDDTGEILVFIYENVLARIPNNTALGVEGARVRVVGTVAIYSSNLEVIPALPYDVVVLD